MQLTIGVIDQIFRNFTPNFLNRWNLDLLSHSNLQNILEFSLETIDQNILFFSLFHTILISRRSDETWCYHRYYYREE